MPKACSRRGYAPRRALCSWTDMNNSCGPSSFSVDASPHRSPSALENGAKPLGLLSESEAREPGSTASRPSLTLPPLQRPLSNASDCGGASRTPPQPPHRLCVHAASRRTSRSSRSSCYVHRAFSGDIKAASFNKYDSAFITGFMYIKSSKQTKWTFSMALVVTVSSQLSHG